MNLDRKQLTLAVGLLLTAVWEPVPRAYALGGLPLWTNFYSGPGNYTDYAKAIGVDRDGNVFVAGYSANSNSPPYNYDYVTVAYSSAGKPLWTNRYNGPGNSDDVVAGLAVSGGNVFVAGYSTSSSGDLDFATVAYSRAGVPLWTNRYDGPGHSNDLVYATAADTNGNVFVTGRSYKA